MRKGDLSKLVDEAVRWRMFDETVQRVKDRNQDLRPDQLEAEIEAAISEVKRSGRRRPRS